MARSCSSAGLSCRRASDNGRTACWAGRTAQGDISIHEGTRAVGFALAQDLAAPGCGILAEASTPAQGHGSETPGVSRPVVVKETEQ